MKHSDINTIYLSYLKTPFDKNRVSEVHSYIYSKPDKGIWASRKDAEHSWSDWCKYEEFPRGDILVKFKLTPQAKILEIHSEEDILPYIDFSYREKLYEPIDRIFRTWNGEYIKTWVCDKLDLDKLYSNFDGIELFISDDYLHLHEGVFNTWDVDSICVWNPDIIEIIGG